MCTLAFISSSFYFTFLWGILRTFIVLAIYEITNTYMFFFTVLLVLGSYKKSTNCKNRSVKLKVNGYTDISDAIEKLRIQYLIDSLSTLALVNKQANNLLAGKSHNSYYSSNKRKSGSSCQTKKSIKLTELFVDNSQIIQELFVWSLLE